MDISNLHATIVSFKRHFIHNEINSILLGDLALKTKTVISTN